MKSLIELVVLNLRAFRDLRKEILDDCHVSLSTKLLALQLVEKFGYEGEMRLNRLLNLG